VRGNLAFRVGALVALALTLVFLAVPILALFTDAGPGELISSLGDSQATEALWLSLRTSLAAIAIIVAVGTPAAYLVATRSFRGRPIVITLIELPLVLPPAAAGIALLASFGPSGVLGGAVENLGVRLVLETAGVVVALTFVSAPFYVRGAIAAFESVDRDLLDASRTLGVAEAGTFLRAAVPNAIAGLGAGLALAWGRALGEFGATLMFAGSLEGVTQTAPLAIFEFLSRDFTASLALSAVLVIVSALLLLGVKLLVPNPVDADA
jgi:molybdate transport system permease protein